jgi:hypothetical protein
MLAGIAGGYRDSLRAERYRDRISAEARFSTPILTGPEAHLVSCIMGTVFFPVVKQPRCGVDHPPDLAPNLKKEYSYSPTSALALRGLFQGTLFAYPY